MIKKILLFSIIFLQSNAYSQAGYHCPSVSVVSQQVGLEAEVKNNTNQSVANNIAIRFYDQNLPWMVNLGAKQNWPHKEDKINFFQVMLNDKLTCYYQWPDDKGGYSDWLSISLVTGKTITPLWEGSPALCQAFDVNHCAFGLKHFK